MLCISVIVKGESWDHYLWRKEISEVFCWVWLNAPNSSLFVRYPSCFVLLLSLSCELLRGKRKIIQSFTYSVGSYWTLLSAQPPVLHEGTMVIINRRFPLLFWHLESTFLRKLMKSLDISHRFCVNSVQGSYGVFGKIRVRSRLHKARGTWFIWTYGMRLCKFGLKSWGVNLDSNMGEGNKLELRSISHLKW